MRSHLSQTIFGATLALFLSILAAPSVNARHHVTDTSGNNVYISGVPGSVNTQVFLLQDYANNITATSLVFKGTTTPITMMNPPNCYGAVNPHVWYFYLGKGQTAQLTNYAAAPMHFALWVPVDSSSNGQNPNTCWFQNTCFSYPATYGSPPSAVPAGATFVEVNFSNSIYDTADISEVNGVNAAWTIDLPTPWFNSAYKTEEGIEIPVADITNNPGASPNFYGDYGNPGVYPFGCTNCASRYNNPTAPGSPPGIERAGCLSSESLPPVTYPTMDVGCNNAINYYPNNALKSTANGPYVSYESPPPGVKSLPFDAYYRARSGKDTLFNLNYQGNPNLFLGYGICELLRGRAPTGGSVNVTLNSYPFGQIQP
jgi:hypothetical protein